MTIIATDLDLVETVVEVGIAQVESYKLVKGASESGIVSHAIDHTLV